MDLPVRSYATGEELAGAAAQFIAACATRALQSRGACALALSGGRSPRRTWEHLASIDLDWEAITIFQVDERVAPTGNPERNLTALHQALASRAPRIVAMDVEAADLDTAAQRYGEALPATFDLVHLGLGPDGHTASLVPGDPVLEVTGRPVATTRAYQGRRRMTLTYAGLARAKQIVWLVTREESRDALKRLVIGDASIPASHVPRDHAVVLTDLAAV